MTKEPHHRVGYERGPIYLDAATTSSYVPDYLREQVKITGENVRKWKDEIQWYQRVPAKRYGALSALMIVDALIRTHRNHEIRTRDFTHVIRREYPQFTWDPTTVGRLMSDLATAGDHIFNMSPLQWEPFARFRDGAGYYYKVHLNAFGTEWLYAIREELRENADRERQDPKLEWHGLSQMSSAAMAVNLKLIEHGLEVIKVLYGSERAKWAFKQQTA